MGYKYFLCCLFSGLLIGCQPLVRNDGLFEKGRSLGTNKNKKLEEASGLVTSVRNPGYLWTINDSGNPSDLFLLDENAQTVKVFKLIDVRNRDWEDITLGAGPEEGVNYLYVGDIGDNLARYPLKYIYRLKEPSLDQSKKITAVDTLVVKLSDGVRDAEALMNDPVSKNLYLISKREDSVHVYEIKYPFAGDTLTANKVCQLPFDHINGGDISPDGNEVLLRNYKHIYYWKKTGHESFVDLIQTPVTELPYDAEPQGESIAWARDGSGFFTLGENAKGERSKLFFYKRK